MKADNRPDLSDFESVCYPGYLQKIGVDILSMRRDNLDNLPAGSVVLKASEGAFCVLNKKEWDKKALGISVFSLEDVCLNRGVSDPSGAINSLIKMVTGYARKHGIRLLTFRFSGEYLKYAPLFERHGFSAADILCTFLYRRSDPLPKKYCPGKITVADRGDRRQILDMPRDSFTFSRIYADPNIPKNKADGFYRELTRSVLDNEDNLTMVCKKEARVCAFAIGGKPERINKFFAKSIGFLWLIYVSKNERRKNYGAGLLNGFLERFTRDTDYVEISTQINNMPAMKLYYSSGLLPAGHMITMHYWTKR